MQQWQPGHKFKNRPYEILQELGQGGFGITYKAKNLSLDVPVVIKTPNSRLQRDKNYSKYLKSFKKEAKQLAKLGMNPHPHIVRVFDFFEEDNLPCIIMDYVPGNSLYDLVQMNGVLPEERALEYIRQIGSALVVCHKQGIIHRDVHPNNILIHADSGKAVLIDFGISGTTQSSRNTRSGNQAFAPWEQLISFGEQSSKTPQVDIYTLAASFYYLITGDTPTPSLARKFNNDDLIEPKQHNPKIKDRINQAILKGMEIEPSDRPQTLQEWLDCLNLSPINSTAKPVEANVIRKEISDTPHLITEQEILVNIKKRDGAFKIAGLFSFVVYFLLELSLWNKFLLLTEDSHAALWSLISILAIFWMFYTSFCIPDNPQETQKKFNIKKYNKSKRGVVLLALIIIFVFILSRKATLKIILLPLPYTIYLFLGFPYNLANLFVKVSDDVILSNSLSNREKFHIILGKSYLLLMSFFGFFVGAMVIWSINS